MERIALLSVHTSPIARPGGKKVGGMNTYIREIAQEFARRGLQVDIYTRRTHPNEPTVDTQLGAGVEVIHVNAGGAVPLGTEDMFPHMQEFTAGVIAHTIKHNIQYDMIFSHYWLSGWVAQKLKEAWGTPFVQMFHTLGHMKNRIPSVQTPVPEIRIRVESQVVEWADAIIANTPAERSQLLWLYHADRRKIWVYPPGVNTQRFHPQDVAQVRHELNIPQDENFLLFVGRIEPLKAVDSIVEAMCLLRKHQPELLYNTTFGIIGGNPNDTQDKDMQALKHMVNTYGLDDVVQFLGAKNHQQLSQYYAAATAVIMPSEYESFGMVALEAMASGTPVIASQVGGLAYLVRENETGYLVPSRNPHSLATRIADILTQPDTRRHMGKKAADLAQDYAWSAIADKLYREFNSLRLPKRRKLLR